MKIIKPLEELRKINRKNYHPIINHIHKKHKISRKTLFYIKEYGSHSNVPKTIIKESIKIVLFASILSTVGGFGLEYIKSIFISIIPLLILLPTLNDLIGDYGAIASSKFSIMLYENKINKKWWLNKELRKLFVQILILSIITAICSSILALIISKYVGYSLNASFAMKIIALTLLDVVLITAILFLVVIIAGIHFYNKKEDPNNFLIPITTSIADFGNMVILSFLVILFF